MKTKMLILALWIVSSAFAMANTVEKTETITHFRPGLEHLRDFTCFWHRGVGGFDIDHGVINIGLSHLQDSEGRRPISNYGLLHGQTSTREELAICEGNPEVIVQQVFTKSNILKEDQCLEQQTETLSGVITNGSLKQNLWGSARAFVRVVERSHCE